MSRWAIDQRQAFIAARLRSPGWINRSCLTEMFGISTQQASLDLRDYQRALPRIMAYNATTKRYEATGRSLLSVGRDARQAARSVAEMDDERIKLFSQHDPDIFRDVARLALSDGALERQDGPPDAASGNSSKPSLSASPQPDDGWRPIESAPKDGKPIVGWCDHKANPYWLENGDLTTYGAHVEGLGHAADGPQIIVWGGEFDDIDEGYIPPWWFRHGSEWEEAANPTHWCPLPPPPSGRAGEGEGA